MLGRFGKFTLVERIAEGGMAEVFKATVRGPEGFERIVAIKRLHRAVCEDADLTQMLVDEARIAVQLNHPNIGNVFDLGCIENQYFIIMEYIDGTDVLHLLRESRQQRRFMPVDAALYIISETLSGLHHAHTKLGRNGDPMGIVHRDVSPQNIMVTWDGRVKLVDFGIAKARNRAQTTQHGIIKGKFYYMAPEQAQGHHVDPRTDVYAAGMVLYELLVGRSPYEDVAEADLLRAVRRADYPPPTALRSDLDPELSALVEVATQRNPDKRFANALEFQLALNDYRHRMLGAFAEPHMARVVAQIANAGESNDNFAPMDRGAYRPSEESLLFEQPDPAALAAAAGGSDIGRGNNNNPFSDDQVTEIYDANARQPAHRQRDLPPPPSPHSWEENTRNELPSRGASQRPFQEPPAPQAARADSRSFVERASKPKILYLAIGLAVLLLVGLGAVLISTRTPPPEPEPEKIAVVEPEEKGPTKVAVAFASEPANAQVFVNDVDRGTTPLSLDLDVGESIEVEFVKDGYEIHQASIVVQDPPQEVTAELAQARGILKILSFPPDAVISIDGEEQGATPLTLTGMETDQTYDIVAKIDGNEMAKKVQWESESESVQEVMFEFQSAEGGQLKLSLGKLPDSIATDSKPTAAPRRKTYKRSRPRRRKKPASTSSGSDDLNVFGSSSKSTSKSSSDDDSLNVFGSSSSKKEEPKKEESSDDGLNVFGSSSKKTTTKKKEEPKKETKKEESSDDDGLNVFGSSSKKKKKKPAPKKKEEDEDLDIW